ncbi:hypothetical protein Afil01_21840 [Actinorhabdospora filicis]|uniref:Lectin n=2 Tax=Actinorhabdospora filicis TaxID=1785913 RepID=A0A9W6W2T6_9ACTN|nr:hypothetical protein Afil01_21840 [Actinorhabdospora filicis]
MAAPAAAIPTPPDPSGVTASGIGIARDGSRQTLRVNGGRIEHRLDSRDDVDGTWRTLYGATDATKVDATYDPNLGLQVVAVIGGQIYHNARFPNGSWSGFAPIYGASDAGDVSIAVQTNGDAHVAAVINGRIWHRVRYWSGEWSPWGLFYTGSDATSVDVAVDGNNELQLAGVVGAQIRHTIRHPGNGAWDAFQPVYDGRAGAPTDVSIGSDPWAPGNGAAVVAAVIRQHPWRIDRYASRNWSGWQENAGLYVRSIDGAVFEGVFIAYAA